MACNMAKKKLQAVKGAFKLHAVVGLGNSQIAFRNVNCYCPQCIDGALCDICTLVTVADDASEHNNVETLPSE